ncbi:MAG: ion transporter [Flavobacteriaceae bacterium]|nr:ion transporter [Flavobacteriaceae bacterium]|tara:strand:+ start:4320 stop:5147 length:828 start_codon:yes stop_codon:yes gene_type:complete
MKKIKSWRHKLHEVIYEADTPAGKTFDIFLLIIIILSIVLVALESVESIYAEYYKLLDHLEWTVTILFTIEYIIRLIAVQKPLNYVFSFYGIIDFLSTIPKYVSLLLAGTQSLVALRALRLLRVFRILKMTRYIGESNVLVKALIASRAKIGVFIFGVLVVCVIFGTIMYMVESNQNSGFTSIPESIYWCIVTLTTVGYGDIAPISPLGQFIAACIMIMGYGVIAVPTGIVTAEFADQNNKHIDENTQACLHCMESSHIDNSIFCHKCGEKLNDV